MHRVGVPLSHTAENLLRCAFAFAFIAAAWRETLGIETIVYVGSFNLTVREPLFALSSAAAVTMWYSHRKEHSIASILVIVLTTILAIDVVRGMMAGPIAALTSLRSTGSFYALLLATLPFGRRCNYSSLILTYLFRCAYFLSAVAFLRLIISPNLLRIATGEDEGRALAAQGSFIIAVAAVAALSLMIRRKQPFAKMAIAFSVFSLTVLATRQGTASTCLIVGSFIVFALQQGAFAAQRRALGAIVLVLASSIYLIFSQILTFDTLISIAPQSMQETLLARQSTLDTREMIWAGVSEAYSQLGFFSQTFGIPAGVKPLVMIDHPSWGYVEWEAGYHSMYYYMLVDFGFIGMITLIALYIAGAFRAFKDLKNSDFSLYSSSAFCLAVIAMCALFSYSYYIEGEEVLFLSLALINMPARVAKPSQSRVRQPMRRVRFNAH